MHVFSQVRKSTTWLVPLLAAGLFTAAWTAPALSSNDPITAEPITEEMGGGSATSNDSSFSWETDHYSGIVAIRMNIDFSHQNRCHYDIRFEVRTEGPMPFRVDLEGISDPLSMGRVFQSPYYVQAHAGPLDTRDVFFLDDSGRWGLQFSGIRDFQGTKQWTIILFNDASNTNSDEFPLRIYLDCLENINVNLQGGREAVAVTADWGAQGGVGATIFPPLHIGSPTSSPQFASIAILDKIEKYFEAPHVLLTGSWWQDNALLTRTTITLAHPEGNESWSYQESEDRVAFFSFKGNGGDYRLGLDHIGYHTQGGSHGVHMAMAGLHLIKSLDDLFD